MNKQMHYESPFKKDWAKMLRFYFEGDLVNVWNEVVFYFKEIGNKGIRILNLLEGLVENSHLMNIQTVIN